MTEQCKHPVYDGAGWNAWPCNQPKGHGGFHGILGYGLVGADSVEAECYACESARNAPDPQAKEFCLAHAPSAIDPERLRRAMAGDEEVFRLLWPDEQGLELAAARLADLYNREEAP